MADKANDHLSEVKAYIKNIGTSPGVYRMYDVNQKVIYVGKARNLKNRVSSYFVSNITSPKTRALVAQIHHLDVIVTQTENEALILENNLIKSLKPRYNVLLRDDKSYPFIFISTEDEFPRISFHRGAKKLAGRYFGPYPSAGAVRESLQVLQKVFPVRQCEDSFYKNRSRPCLQYQIKRCTAPCVNLVTVEDYRQDVEHAIKFLEGKSHELIAELAEKMEQASSSLAFEQAATYRDQIGYLRRVQEKQYIDAKSGDIDVIAVAQADGVACLQVFFIRHGQNLGSKTFYPKHSRGSSDAEIISAFIPQYYLGQQIPKEIVVSERLEEKSWLQDVLTQQAGRKVHLQNVSRGERVKWLEMAQSNAQKALSLQLMSKNNLQKRVLNLQQALELSQLPRRLECFDISHTFGEETVASCVVFEDGAPLKSDYRRFNIKGIVKGDDYEAMRQALLRRYQKLKEDEGKRPDLLIIDGGRGQVNAAIVVMEALQLGDITLIGVSKGEGRKPGLESLHIATTGEIVTLAADSPALHLIQSIRDEAHRFAITGHRQRRDKARKRSTLEDIEGLGPKRRRALLSHFGGLQQVTQARVEDIARVPGISVQLAQRVYDLFHVDENEP